MSNKEIPNWSKVLVRSGSTIFEGYIKESKWDHDQWIYKVAPSKEWFLQSEVSVYKTFEIWVEGYLATGESGTAHKIGEGSGINFNDAVKDYMSNNPDHGINESNGSERGTWSIWGCILFDNEQDARKSFG